MAQQTGLLKRAGTRKRQGSIVDRMARPAVLRLLGGLQGGALRVTLPEGERLLLGDPAAGPTHNLRITTPGFFGRLALCGDVGFGEAYCLGEVETDDLVGVLQLFIANMGRVSGDMMMTAIVGQLANAAGHLLRRNTTSGALRNISYHYDLSNDFFRLWLDETMTYSSALWEHPGQSLAEAQRTKIRALLNRVQARPGDHLLEIGSGWGELALTAARDYGCRVTTLTLSREQLAVVRQRAAAAGLSDRITPLLCDYRKAEGQFDKVVSVEMIEAVGHEYLPTYFGTIDRLLKPNGIAAIQAITIPDQRYDAYRRRTDWIQKYIFPGAVVPSISAMTAAMAKGSQLVVENIDNFGPHYARTLHHWREVFNARLADVKALGFDDYFCRVWDYYLAYCEAGFASRVLGVVHMTMSRPHNLTLANRGLDG